MLEAGYSVWQPLGHQTRGHGHACCSLSKGCGPLPISATIPGHGEVAAAQKDGVWLSFSNHGRLSPVSSPHPRVTQGSLGEGRVFGSEAGISVLVALRGPWACWMGHHFFLSCAHL